MGSHSGRLSSIENRLATGLSLSEPGLRETPNTPWTNQVLQPPYRRPRHSLFGSRRNHLIWRSSSSTTSRIAVLPRKDARDLLLPSHRVAPDRTFNFFVAKTIGWRQARQRLGDGVCLRSHVTCSFVALRSLFCFSPNLGGVSSNLLSPPNTGGQLG